MKILHLTRNFYPVTGGIETYIFEISKRMVKNGYEVCVIASDTHPTNGTRFPKYEVVKGIKVFRVLFHRFLRYNLSLEAVKLLTSLKPDIIHIHGLGLFSDLVPFLKIFWRKKIIVSTHGGIFHTKYASVLKKIYFNTFSRLALSFADRIIAHSLQDEKTFSRICKKNKIVLSHYGIEWKKLSKTKRNSNRKTLIYIGRLAKNKRIDRALNVLFYVKKKVPDVKLLLVGEDWGVKKGLMELAKKLDVLENVIFVGYVPHEKISKYFSRADIFMLPSEYEGFGISVLEAMATGLPVIVNEIETMREIVKNEYNGYLVDFNDYEKVAEVVLKVLKHKPDSNRIKNSVKNFDWNNILKQMEEMIKDV